MLLWMPWGQLHREGFEEILQESNSHKFVEQSARSGTFKSMHIIVILGSNLCLLTQFHNSSSFFVQWMLFLFCVLFSVLVVNKDAAHDNPEDDSDGIFVFFGLCLFFCLGCQWGCHTRRSRGRLRGNFCFLCFVFFFLSWLPMRMPHMTIQRTTQREWIREELAGIPFCTNG